HPRVLLVGRQAALELADVPGAGDVEREVAAAERVPDVGDGRTRKRRRPAAPEDLDVEAQGATKACAPEIPPAPAIAQERVVLLQRQRRERLELVQRQEDRVASGAPLPV